MGRWVNAVHFNRQTTNSIISTPPVSTSILDNNVIQPSHSLLKLSLKTGNKHEKGRGFWKLNSSLLHDPVYVDKIKNVILETAQIYEGLEDKRMLGEITKLEIVHKLYLTVSWKKLLSEN